MKFFTKNYKAYSILELIVYLALFGMLSVVLVNIAVGGSKVYRTVRANRDFIENGALALERITRSVRSATATTGSTFDTSPGVLVLTTSAGTTTFDVSGSSLRLTDTTASGSTTDNITGGGVTVTSLIFNKITTAQGDAIKTKVTLYNTLTGKSENFYATTIMRAQY